MPSPTEAHRRVREFVNWVFVHRPRALLSVTSAILVVACGAFALRLLGVLPDPAALRPGAIPVAATATLPPQAVVWAQELALEDPPEGGELAGLPAEHKIDVDWLDAAVCRADLKTPAHRAARAWRLDANPTLCRWMDRRLGMAPLLVEYGLPLGLLITLLILVGVPTALYMVVREVARTGVAYRRLYGSEYRHDRRKQRRAP